MNRSDSAAAKLPEPERQDLAVQALAGAGTISALAAQHGVSRKFVYAQTDKARAALKDAFASAVGFVRMGMSPLIVDATIHF
jgi:transposase-like protein